MGGKLAPHLEAKKVVQAVSALVVRGDGQRAGGQALAVERPKGGEHEGEPEAVPLGLATLPADDWEQLLAFQKKTASLRRVVLGAIRTANEAQSRIDHVQVALRDTPGADPGWVKEARALELRLADLRLELEGDRTIRSRNEPTPPSIRDRINYIIYGSWESTSSP